jgi:hypothetical protein
MIATQLQGPGSKPGIGTALIVGNGELRHQQPSSSLVVERVGGGLVLDYFA